MAIINAMEDLREDLTVSNSSEFKEEISNIEDGLADADHDLVIANEDIDNKLASLRVAVEAYDDYKSNRISFDQFKYSVFAAESAVFGEDSPVSVIANEAAVLDRLAASISGVLTGIKVSFSKTGDYLQYAYSWFSMQRGAINSLRTKLSRVQGDRVQISVGINKYMRFGANQNVVRDMGEYNTQYRLMAQAMAPFTNSMAELTEDDLFSGLKIIKEAFTGDPEKWFEERFFSVEGHLKRAMSGIATNVGTKNRKFTEYVSPVMLGLSSVTVRMPNKDLYRSGGYEDLYGAHRYFYAFVDRKVKIQLSTILDGSIQLEVRKSDLLKNLDESSKLIEGALKLTSMATRFSNEGAVLDGAGNFFSKRKQEEGFSVDIFETMMFYRRICSMIYDSVSSAYNFSMGNIKQMNRIADKAVDKF